MDGWQSKSAFVVQFKPTTDVASGRIEGKVEHVSSYRSARFQSAEELFAFVNRILSEIKSTEQQG